MRKGTLANSLTLAEHVASSRGTAAQACQLTPVLVDPPSSCSGFMCYRQTSA